MAPDVYDGTAPLTVTFTTNSWSRWDEDGTIDTVEIDPEGAGNWVGFNPATGYQYVYNTPGQYHPRLRATDDQGTLSYSSTELVIFVN
jgi:hypothetical protein